MIEALTAEIDRLVETDPSVLANEKSLLALHREVARLRSVVTRAIEGRNAGG